MSALYAYAVTMGGMPLPQAPGILPGLPLLALDEAGLTVLASQVPEGFFDAAEDPDWLGARAEAHHRVVAAVPGPTLPLALGAVFPDPGSLRLWLRQRARRFGCALAAVSGCAEWSVTLEEDVAQHAAWLRQADPDLARPATSDEIGQPTAPRPGAALLAARQARRRQAAQDLARLLGAEARHLAPTRPEAGAVAGWAALLAGDAQRRLRKALDTAAMDLAGTGLVLSLAGPFPPYAYAREAARDA
ncbi:MULTISPECIES: GvpL/GvpF family gas vesicle protein [Roseomonadaceae]|uniref:GvpL/GvpF family gas vesicle protein n=1 Tax=Falsiroseomonas oleicola TaxID=2801474 RepID=A0ABS6H4S9_9PROT|nr:GvpL/GvpF family gas vesicle protein [Roseomonas oleicola]MBU8543690.1 GvpL/GvpF family gas vesicle protein [Roseomonas oleicola]